MNVYLIIFLMLAGVTVLPLLIIVALRTIAYCKLIEGKYPKEDKTYTCAVCKNTFEEDWTEEEAIAELHETFGNFSTDECAVVCDDCYKEFMEDWKGKSQ